MLVCSAPLLTGCAGLQDKLSTYGAGDGRLAVAIPEICEAFLQPVPPPAVTPKSYAPLAYTRTADALDTANDRIAGGRDCIQDQRRAYAAKKEKPK